MAATSCSNDANGAQCSGFAQTGSCLYADENDNRTHHLSNTEMDAASSMTESLLTPDLSKFISDLIARHHRDHNVTSSSPAQSSNGVIFNAVINTVVRKLFYAGQIFYLEGFFRSAEIEYWSCVSLLLSTLQHASSLEDDSSTDAPSARVAHTLSQDEVSYIRALYACCLVNIAVARVHQPNSANKQATHGVRTVNSGDAIGMTAPVSCAELYKRLLGVTELMSLSAIALCDYSLSINDDRLGQLRKYFVLEKLKKSEQGLQVLDDLSSSSLGEFTSLPTSYVTDYGDRVVFSQKYTGDVSACASGMPFMTARTDEEVASSFYQFVSRRGLDISNKMGL